MKYFNYLFYAGVKKDFHPGVNFSILFLSCAIFQYVFRLSWVSCIGFQVSEN